MLVISGRKECKNGPGCRFLAQKRCVFYHPPEHSIPKKPTSYVSYNSIWDVKVQNEDIPTVLTGNVKWFFLKNKHFNSKKQIKHLKYQECSICVMDYEDDKDGTRVTQFYCGHNFHKDCIQKWLQNSMACPLCKHDFREHQQYKRYDQFYKERIQEQHKVTAPLSWDDIESEEDYYYGDYQEGITNQGVVRDFSALRL